MNSPIGRALLGNDRGRFSVPACSLVIVVVSLLLLLLPDATLFDAYLLLAIALAAIVTLIGIVFDDRMLLRNVQLAFTGGLILTCLTLSFAGVYYRQSQAHPTAYNVRLDRLTAVYVAIGTLSTNGTQGVQPRSGQAQAESALQEVVDATVVVLFFGALMWRLGYRTAAHDDTPDQGPRARSVLRRPRRPGDSPAGHASPTAQGERRQSRLAKQNGRMAQQTRLHLMTGDLTQRLNLPSEIISNSTSTTTTSKKTHKKRSNNE
jgi:hypothetical protein